MNPTYVYRAQVKRVIDADTYVLVVDLGFRASLEIEGRLRDVNAPELNTPEGKEARLFVVDLFTPPLDHVVIESYKDRRSFTRWVIDVWLPDGNALQDILVQAGQAVRVT